MVYGRGVGATLDAIGLVMADMAESCRFYRTLGVDVGEPAPDNDHFEATLPSGVRLMWDSEEMTRQIEPEWTPPTGQRISLAFDCVDAAGVDATHARLVEARFRSKREPWDAFWGQRYAFVLDPDGNTVSLFASLS
jgi:catechol 2,3-dioxygenase-like lactoylglutathione lyase family enzyme